MNLWDGILLARLKGLFPDLQRVLCHRNPMSFIWQFDSGCWKKREVQPFLLWDVIRGALDDERDRLPRHQ